MTTEAVPSGPAPSVPIPFREASVDLAAIEANTAEAIRVGASALVADLGADAFGHGALACGAAVIAGGATAVLVPRVAQGVALRASGVAVPIAVWQHEPDEDFAEAAAADLTVIAASADEFVRARAAGVRVLGVIVETGSGYPGMRIDHLPALADRAIWLMGTLPGVDDPSRAGAESAVYQAIDGVTALGGRVAEVVLKTVGDLSTLPEAATAGCLGAELFGVSEVPGTEPDGMRPAMTLWAPIVALKRVPADAGVSYGFTYRTSGPSTLALVSLGYGDGVDRAAGNAAPVSIAGRRYRLSGRVAMDAFVADLGQDEPPPLGDPAVLFGDPRVGHPAVEEWAAALGVASAEVTTRLTARVRRTHR